MFDWPLKFGQSSGGFVYLTAHVNESGWHVYDNTEDESHIGGFGRYHVRCERGGADMSWKFLNSLKEVREVLEAEIPRYDFCRTMNIEYVPTITPRQKV